MEEKVMNENVMERKETLRFLKSLNEDCLDGFDISTCAESMFDATRGTNSSFLPLSVKEVWFKKKYPLSRVEWKVTFPLDDSMEMQENIQKMEVTAKAVVCVNGIETEIGNAVAVMYSDDDAVKDIPAEKGKRYDAMKAFCIGTARSKALFNAGFGRQFYGEEVDLQLLQDIGKEEKEKKESSTLPSQNILDAALDVLKPSDAGSTGTAGFVPVVEETSGLDITIPKTFQKTSSKEEKPSKGGFQNTLDGYFEEVLGLVPNDTGDGLVPNGAVCMRDEVLEQHQIIESAEGTVAEEARKHLKKCEKRLAAINTWITKRGTVKMDSLYRSDDRIPLTIEQLLEMAKEKAVDETSENEMESTSLFDMPDEDIDAVGAYSDSLFEDMLSAGFDVAAIPVQTSLFESTDCRNTRCTSEKGDFFGKTYGDIVDDNPDVLSYLLDDDTPDSEANAICSLAKELAEEDNKRFADLYKSVLRKENIRKEAFAGVGEFS